MYKFSAFLDRMKYIKRWSLMRSVREENIMEHTQQVTVIAHALALVKNRIYGGSADVEKTVLYALYHETGEVITAICPRRSNISTKRSSARTRISKARRKKNSFPCCPKN